MKKNSIYAKAFSLIFLFIFVLVSICISCEIGLGSAIDVEPPSLTIDSPEVDKVIKDKFFIKGTWGDDGTIESLYVILKRTDGNPIDGNVRSAEALKEYKIDGTIEKNLEEKDKGTWKVEINPLDEEKRIIDGTYLATVFIKDKGNHTTSQSVSFTIDNTPPVLILSKPNSVPGDKTMSVYGQRLFLEGSIADSTKETWIEISFYSDEACQEDSLLTTIETGLIAPTDVNSNNAKLAAFDTNLDADLAQEYFDIYRSLTKEDSKTVYSTITVYDTAETCYENEGQELEQETSKDGKIKGNASKTFFISKQLAELITKSQSAGGYGLAPIDIYNVLNGTYELKNSSRSIDAETVKAKLENDDSNLKQNKTVFKMNPQNSPYFTVSGLKALTKTGRDFEKAENGYFVINGAQTLEISVFMGSDNIELVDNDDFYVYLLACDEKGEPLEEDKEENRIKLYSKSNETGSGADKKTYYSVGGKETHKTTSGAYVFTIPIAKNINANPDAEGTNGIIAIPIEYGNYVIRVSGKDNEENPIEPYEPNGYGFHLTTGGSAPELKVEEPADNTLFNKEGDGLTFKGTVKVEEGNPSVSVWNGKTKLVDIPVFPERETEDNAVVFEGSFTAEELKFNTDESPISLIIRAAGAGEVVTDYQKSIWYDGENPLAANIKFSEVTVDAQGKEIVKDVYSNESSYFINNLGKTFTLSGIATDNVGVEKADLKITNKTDESKTITDTSNASTGKWVFKNIDLRSWTGDGATIEITLQDKSGNQSKETLDVIFDVIAPAAEHQIDDSQKDLVFRIGDYANDRGDSDVGGKYSNGTYGSALTMQIRGNYPDNENGSGIKKFYYKVFNNQEVIIDSVKAPETTPVVGTGNDDGKIFFKSLEVLKDYVIANKTETFSPLSENEERFVEYNIKPQNTPANEQNTIDRIGGGTLTNNYVITSKGYVQFRKSITTNFKTTIKGFSEGRNYLVLVAEDNVGNTSVDYAEVPTPENPAVTAIYPCYSLNVDITAPNIPSKQEGTVYTNVTKKKETGEENPDVKVEISGTVSDKSNVINGSSGLKNIVFTSDQNNEKVTLNAASLTGNGTEEDLTLRNWTVDVRPLLSKKGTAIISAKVTDNAGYETSMPVANILVDKDAPVVRITSPSSNTITGTDITLSGTVSDGNGAGLDTTKQMELFYKTNLLNDWEKLADITTAENWTYNLDAKTITQDAENTPLFFMVTATDKAGSGNTGYSETLSITVDRKKPEMNDEKSGIGDQKTAANVNEHWFKTTTLKVFGEYTDFLGSGTTTISYKIGEGNENDLSTTDGTYNINISDFVKGANSITIWATDKAGNKSEETVYNFNIDNELPVIQSVAGPETTQGEDVILTVNIKDENPVKPDVIVKQNGTAIEPTLDVTVSEPSGAGSVWASTVTIPFNSIITTDGTYEFEITVKDKAGNSSASVTKRITRDNVPPVIVITKPESASGAFIQAGSYKFEGTITDITSEIKQAKAELWSVPETGEPVKKDEAAITPNSSDGGKWSWQVYELAAAAYKIKVTAEDTAGNFAVETESPLVYIDNTAPVVTVKSSCSGEAGEEHFDLTDSEVNEIETLVSGKTYYAKGVYSLIVSVDDLNFDSNYDKNEDGIKDLFTITATNNAEEQTFIITPDDNNPRKFTIRPVVYVEGVADYKINDGVATYKINVEDKAGNKADEIVIKVQLDTTGPVVSINKPGEDITKPENSLSESTYSFKIYAGDSGVGVAKLFYAFTTNSEKPADSEWIEESFTDGDRYIEMGLVAGKNPVYTNGKITSLCEGNWYLYAKAQDKSGNETETETIARRAFPVDRANPTLTVSDLSESGENPLSTEIEEATETEEGGYTISGTVQDTNGLAESNAVMIEVDKQEAEAATIDGENWSYKIKTGTTDGKLKSDAPVEVKITATDIAGKTTQKTYILYYDTKAPDLTVSAPVENEPVADSNKSIKGTVSDNGYGIDKIEYVLYKGTITETNETEATTVQSGEKNVTSENFPVEIKGEQWYIKDTATNMPLGTKEGALTLKVIATEKTIQKGTKTYGGRKTAVYRPFYYDKANPVLEENKIGTRGITTKTTFKFKGKAWDSNELDRIEIWCGNTVWKSTDDNSFIELTKATEDPGENKTNWSAEFVVGSNTGINHIPDGTKEFTIIAYDISGKEKQLTRSVVVDTQNPVIDNISVDQTHETEIDDVIWHTSTSLPIEVEASDFGDSGLSKVEYKVGTGDWTPLSFADEYKGTINFASNGEQRFKIKATDVAGNSSDEDENEITVHIDTTAPDLLVLYYSKGTATTETLKAIENTLYLKSNTQITVYGNYKDDQTGVKELTFKLGDSEISENITVKYSTETIENKETILEIENADENSTEKFNSYEDITDKNSIKSWKAVLTPNESKKLSVIGTNRTDRPTEEIKISDITIDKESPVPSNIKLFEITKNEQDEDVTKDAYLKNNNYYVKQADRKFKITGVATDNIGLDSVVLTITKDNTTTTVSRKNSGSPSQWIFTDIDLSSWTDAAEAEATVTVTDKAGNVGTSKINISFDNEVPVFSTGTVGGKENALVNTAWFKDTTLNVSGAFTDTGCGVTTIKYKIGSSGDETSVSTTDGNYNTNISGFNPGTNTLYIWAIDALGNESEQKEYTVQLDNNKPVLEKKTNEFDATYLTNGSKIQKFDFYIKEAESGITNEATEFTLKLGTKTIALTKAVTLENADPTKSLFVLGTKEGTEENTKYPVEIQLGTTAFDNVSGAPSVTVSVKDTAGNISEETLIGTMDIDKTAPVPSFTTPVANAKINKEVTIKGKITEKNTVASISLTATYDTGENIKTNTFTYEKDNNSNTLIFDETEKEWEVTIDTNSVTWNNTNAAQNWSFSLTATDEAGNVATDAVVRSFTIDQNSDRPVIKFSNLDISRMTSTNRIWITKQDLYASVTDDDGEVKAVEISFDGTNWKSEDSKHNKYYTPENGLSYPLPSDKDGEQTIYFKVTDANDTVFTSTLTSNAAVTTAPKLAYKTTEFGATEGKYYSVLYSKIDLGDPKIPLAYYITTNEDSAPVANAEGLLGLIKTDAQGKLLDELTDSAKQTWKDLTGIKTIIGGPESNYVWIFVKAKDENGILEIFATLGESALNPPVYKINTSDKGLLALFKKDISEVSDTNEYKLEIKATDNASHNTSRNFDIKIDKEAPQVFIDSPSANAEIYGTAGVAQTNVTVRGRTSDSSEVSNIYLAVTTGESVEPAQTGASAYKDITKKSALSWTAIFNGGQDTSEDVYYTDLFNNYVESLYGAGTTTNASQKDICLWLYAVDKLGNSGKENSVKLPLTILTQGDKPIVSITYPTKESKVGGVITITGSTSIATNEVDKIYVQIDPNYDHENPDYDITNNEFASEWETSLQTLITTATTAGKTIEYSVEDIKNSENTVVARGIVAGGSKQSWNVILNAASEFNTEGNRDIAVRAYAISKSNKISEPVINWFTLDPDSPTFGNNEPLTLVQYSDNDDGTGTVIASQLYTPGMWIQGKWWLTGSVEDESGIAYVKLNDVNLDTQYYQVKTTPYKGWKLNIPVGKAIDSETVYGPNIRLVTKESGGEKTSQMDIKFYYDNIPPDFECTTLKSDDELEEDETNTLVQSDGVCEIKGTLKELGEQSGFKRIAFYVTRTLNSTNYVTDVMKAQGSGTDNCYEQSSLSNDENLYWQTAANCTAKNGIEIEVPEASVPAFARTGGLCRINDVIYTIKSITAGANGKKIITIDSKIDNGTVDVDFILAQVIDNTVSELGITTYFGDTTHGITNDDGDEMVESYKESSGEWTVSINSKNIKDGTIQLHFVAYDQAGNKTYKTYNAIVANNAPRIAGVKFGTDTNGNGDVEGSELRTGYSGIYAVEGLNKKPNITVNGQAANGVKISKLALPNNGTDITAIDNTKNSVMTVKGAIKVIPEVVGGNNGLSWTYSVNGTNKSTTANSLNNTHSGNDDIRAESATTISIDTLTLLKDISSDGNTVLGFTIWDKTEGTTPGTDSNKAELLLKVNVELRDETPPTAGIKPFYWDSIPIGDKNNSSVVYKDGIAFGHIELEKDLPETGFDYDGTDGQEFDLDPKVSGAIYLEGFAQDNVAVEKLYLNFPGLSGFENFGLVAQRDREDDSETKGQIISVPKFVEKGVELISATEELKIDGNKEYNLVHWKIKIDTSRITTSAATNVLVQIKAEDRGKATIANGGSGYNYQGAKQSDVPTTFVLAKNQTGYKLGEDGNVEMSNDRPVYDSENQTPSYRIDVVPYIAKVYTSLASLKKNNWSVYNRTALGHYPIASDGTAYLYGFNLGNADKLPNYGSQALAVPADGSVSNANYSSGSDYAAYKVVTFPISDEIPSGQISLKVNDVETLNNKNNNEARGSYTGSVDLETNPTGDKNIFTTYYYNRQPNGDNNNRLTDDIEIDIWEIDPTAVYPMRQKGSIAQAIMKINPVTDQLGFAFANAAAYFSMPGKTVEAARDTSASAWDGQKVKAFSKIRDYSYTYWNGELEPFTSVGFTYDKYGYSYGVASGGDINSGSNETVDWFSFMTDRWGKALGSYSGGDDYARHKSSKHDQNAVRIETNGLKEGDVAVFETKRIKSPSIVVSAHGEINTSADTNVYLAYFDVLTAQIRFRAGNIGQKLENVDSNNYSPATFYQLTAFSKSKTTGQNFYSVSENIYWNLTDGNRVKIYKEQDGEKVLLSEKEYIIYNLDYNAKKFALLSTDEDGNVSEEYPLYNADTSNKLEEGTYYVQAVPEKSKGFFGNFTNTYGTKLKLKDLGTSASTVENLGIIVEGTTAGEYLSMGVIPKDSTGGISTDDVLVIVWYGDDLQLHYAYNTTPSTIRGNGDTDGWISTTLFTGDLSQAGEYCQLVVDAKGGIHIAGLDSTNSDLIYAYIAKYNEPNNVQTCIVDSSGIVGDNLMIDVAMNGSGTDAKAVPRISYYNSSTKRPKLAYLVDTTQANPAGASNDMFTGKWECSVIPTSSKIDLSDSGNKINVGVWKDDNGVIKNSTPITKVQSVDHVNNYYSTSYGIVGGNGSANAVLGYIVKKDSTTNTIETAQMR
ncbi:MAG: hypothetical protein J5710_14630 [Treponema sp.]|nr:hypothetical protein [Treponema sp.]